MQAPTNPPSEQEITQYVVDQLAEFANREDLILNVCNAMDWQWDRADLFIKAVQERHLRRISLRQAPWMVVLAGGGLVVGLILTAGVGVMAWDVYRGEMLSSSMLSKAPRLVYGFFIGLTMIIGSLGGLWVFMSQVIRGR